MRHLRTAAIRRRAMKAGATLCATFGVRLGLAAGGFHRFASSRFALLFVLLLAIGSIAHAGDRIAPRRNLPPPHVIFFTDYFLYSAQKDLYAMTTAEQSALAAVLDSCPHMLVASETLHLKSDIGRYRYLIRYRQGRHIDRPLDAMQFMTSQFRYNQIIGRGSQTGMSGRLDAICAGLRSALHFAAVRGD
jgi:hypothetical protein